MIKILNSFEEASFFFQRFVTAHVCTFITLLQSEVLFYHTPLDDVFLLLFVTQTFLSSLESKG